MWLINFKAHHGLRKVGEVTKGIKSNGLDYRVPSEEWDFGEVDMEVRDCFNKV